MCTVSFVPIQNGFVFHSNRDENSNRLTLPPQIDVEFSSKLLYPKDEIAGGTWIIAKENYGCLILLNGAFENHIKKPPYRKSRGLILKELSVATNPVTLFSEIDLDKIEPFTIIVFFDQLLTELKWDGNSKYSFSKSIKQPHIWSSATLYTPEQTKERKQWFEDFCKNNQPLTPEKLMAFHSKTQPQNTEYGLIINRKEQAKTVSITQLILEKNSIKMTYFDRLKNTVHSNSLPNKMEI